MYEMIAELQKHGFAEVIIRRFEQLDLIAARNMFTVLMDLTNDQINTLNYYERELNRVGR